MKTENPFRIFYDRVHSYFTHSLARRILFFGLCAGLVFSVVQQIWSSRFVVCAILLCAAICSFSTLVDSVQSKHNFTEQLKDLKADYINRVFEKEGNDGLAALGSVFSREELLFMRKKKREYNYMIVVKLLFAIIFVVLFVNMI